MDVPALSVEGLDIFHLQRTVDSTQDEAKRFIDTIRPEGSLAVIAQNQRKGRGTTGRRWVSVEGNLFMTVAIPRDVIPPSKLTLLPLGVGLIIAQTLKTKLKTNIFPTVKWPNDVLIDGRKIAGTLIENHSSNRCDFWLVGVGVNVQSHPPNLPSETQDFRPKAREATHLHMFSDSTSQNLPVAFDLGVSIAVGLQQWVDTLGSLDVATFVSSWKSWADFGVPYELRETGERLIIVDLQEDGQLRVIDSNGVERLLMADYFF